jgi:hypothetical protein
VKGKHRCIDEHHRNSACTPEYNSARPLCKP